MKRVGGLLGSLAWIAGFGWELLTVLPDEAVSMVFGIMHRQSFFIAMVALGGGVLVVCAWPAIHWAWEIPQRRREREASEAKREAEATERKKKAAVRAMEQLQSLLESNLEFALHASPAKRIERDEEIRVLKAPLLSLGVVPQGGTDDSNEKWAAHVSRLLPAVRMYGLLALPPSPRARQSPLPGYPDFRNSHMILMIFRVSTRAML